MTTEIQELEPDKVREALYRNAVGDEQFSPHIPPVTKKQKIKNDERSLLTKSAACSTIHRSSVDSSNEENKSAPTEKFGSRDTVKRALDFNDSQKVNATYTAKAKDIVSELQMLYRRPRDDALHLKYIRLAPDEEILIPGLKQLQLYHSTYIPPENFQKTTGISLPSSYESQKLLLQSMETMTARDMPLKKKKPVNPDIYAKPIRKRFKFGDIIDWIKYLIIRILCFLYILPETATR
jgi:hypothetical protein